MLFKPFLIERILNCEKTQTRRVAKSNEMLSYPDGIEAVQYTRNDADCWRTKWQVGKTYAICPGRGKHGVARIEITAISRGDVRQISEADARAEGFTNREEFLTTWIAINDKRALKLLNSGKAIIESADKPFDAEAF